MAKVLLAFPNHNLPFDIYADASKYQMKTVIIQKGNIIAHRSRKLTAAQRNYAKIKKKLPCIVLFFKEFWYMILEADINFHNDHTNLTFCTLKYPTRFA